MSEPGDTVACLRIAADESYGDELCWRLEQLRATAIETRDASTLTSEQRGRVLILAGFGKPGERDRARVSIAAAIRPVEIASVDVGDDGWSAGWREFHQPVVLEEIEVLTPWMQPGSAGRTAIVIDPGRAFGTGGHATTRLLLEMLEQRSRTGRLPEEVLDVGTGSGVLAIAAIKLGSEHALAIDIDPEAVAVARENAELNRVGRSVEIEIAIARDLDGSYGLVLANIDLPTFESSAADIADLVSADGEVLLSGLLVEQTERCLELWPEFGVAERLDRDGWTAVALGRRR
jgi:ribosomal protein L11 methyltransferase